MDGEGVPTLIYAAGERTPPPNGIRNPLPDLPQGFPSFLSLSFPKMMLLILPELSFSFLTILEVTSACRNVILRPLLRSDLS